MQQSLDATIASLWYQALGIERVEADASKTFFELGGYSLLALQLVDRVNARLGMSCSQTAVLEHDTLARFSEYVAKLRVGGAGEQGNGVVPGPSGAAPSQAATRPTADGAAAPLSELQQAYWAGENAAFELAGAASWYMEYRAEQLDVSRFASAWNAVVQRHPMLRTVFSADAQQRVLSEVPDFPITFEDLTQLGASEREQRVAAWQHKLRQPSRELDEWPLIDVCVLRLPTELRVILSGRLIIIDGRSASVLASDLWACYQGEGDRLPEIGLTFAEYLARIGTLRAAPTAAESLAYWEARLPSLPEAPSLPVRAARTAARATMRRSQHILSPARWRALRRKAASLGVTPTVAICNAYAQVLGRWGGSRHFTLNMMHGNRQQVHQDVQNVMGCFSDTLLLEVDLAGESLLDDAKKMQEQLFRDMKHAQLVSGVDVIRRLCRQRRSVSGAPLMPVAFASSLGVEGPDEAGAEPYFLDRFSWELLDSELQTPQVILDHQIVESGGGLRLQWDCRDTCLAPGVSDDMFCAYVALVESLIDGDLEVWRGPKPELTPQAQLMVRTRVNAAEREFDTDVTLPQLFLRSAQHRPDALALIIGEQSYTYGTLLAWALEGVRQLRAAGAAEHSLVGVLAPKGAEQVCATLAISLLGAAYVPLSIDNPSDRNQRILEQCGVSHVFTSARHIVPLGATRHVSIPEPPQEETGSYVPSLPAVSSSEVAYVIFTSGSTGTPKGVAVSHRAAVNTILDVNRRFGLGVDSRVLGLSELNFDLSVYDIFGTFAEGGTLVLPEPDLSRNPVHLAYLLEHASITFWNSVPAFAEMLVEYAEARTPRALSSLRVMLLSGDWIPIDLPDRLRALNPRLRVISLGGATEAAIWSNYFEVGSVDPTWTSIPYGYPLANQAFHVLDDRLRPVPDWVAGELYIAGAGLANGYYGAEALTREKFPCRPPTGERLYRTGDFGRYWSDGTLEFLGRRDTQVKIRGHRIELGDIEAALVRHPAIREAAAIVAGSERADRRLVAYYVLATQVSGEPVEARSIKEWLMKQLPAYMLPSATYVLDHLPLTSNGKVDRLALARRALEAPEVSELRVPALPEEARMAAIFSELLGCAVAGARTNFFEAGGNSITAFRLLQRVQREFSVELPLSALYENPTVAELVHHMSASSPGRASSMVLLKTVPRSHTPLFCVHPVGGHVFCYWPLAHLWKDAVWAFQSHGTINGAEPDLSISDMARRYTEHLEALYSGTEVRLLGWSMGGLVTLEMARLLEAKGRRASVVLLDTLVALEPRNVSDAELLRDFFHDLSGGSDLEVGPLHGLSVAEALRVGGQLLRDRHAMSLLLDEATLARSFDVFAANTRAILQVQPIQNKSRILCLHCASPHRSARLSQLRPISETPLWRQGLPRLSRHAIAGNHFSIVQESILAEELPRLERFYAEGH